MISEQNREDLRKYLNEVYPILEDTARNWGFGSEPAKDLVQQAYVELLSSRDPTLLLEFPPESRLEILATMMSEIADRLPLHSFAGTTSLEEYLGISGEELPPEAQRVTEFLSSSTEAVRPQKSKWREPAVYQTYIPTGYTLEEISMIVQKGKGPDYKEVVQKAIKRGGPLLALVMEQALLANPNPTTEQRAIGTTNTSYGPIMPYTTETQRDYGVLELAPNRWPLTKPLRIGRA